MSDTEPALAHLHECTPDGRVARGPQRSVRDVPGRLARWSTDYVTKHGHPRLRMRHGRVIVNLAMRDAWLRCMQAAMTERGITGAVRTFLDKRFAEVADFMRNAEG